MLSAKIYNFSRPRSLHLAWGVAKAKCIVVTAVYVSLCLSVCLSLAAFPHYCTDPDVSWGEWYGVHSSCALLDGFAMGARVSLLWQHSAEREMSASVCTLSVPGVNILSVLFYVGFFRLFSSELRKSRKRETGRRNTERYTLATCSFYDRSV